ncbi:hypothetical protein CYG49_03305 [Candidatus Saccharibacteria bacterium]|nr:MAG: hypothetical protein CYG49_03305 [Candidatus Saccharibacteria bacterium]
MNPGPMSRKPKRQKTYLQHLKQKGSEQCNFCKFKDNPAEVVADHRLFWITTNLFPYDMWDNQGVETHLMIVPKRHVQAIGDFTNAESKEFLALVSLYEENGFSLYLRAPTNSSKSIPHQHSHLIRTDNKHYSFMFYMSKPHINLMK